MRRNEKEIKDQALLDGIIKKTVVMRLGLCDGNLPYVVPLNFGYSENAFYFHCANEGRKLEVIKKNPNVCIEIDGNTEIIPGPKGKACTWSANFQSIIATGIAKILTDVEEKRKGLDLIMKQYTDENFEYGENAINGVTVVKIDISQITGKESTN